MGPALVSSPARRYLLNRVRFALGPSGRTYWQQRDLAGKSISASSSRTTRRPLFSAAANALLVQFELFISSFSLRRRCRFVVASNHRIHSSRFAHRIVRLLPVAYDRWTSFSELSMGFSAA